jgi:hypothetical protein
VKILWADASKFRAATGWEPRIPFEQTLGDLLDYWRARTKSESGIAVADERNRATASGRRT